MRSDLLSATIEDLISHATREKLNGSTFVGDVKEWDINEKYETSARVVGSGIRTGPKAGPWNHKSYVIYSASKSRL